MAASIGWDGVEFLHLVCLWQHGRRGEGRVVDLVAWSGWVAALTGDRTIVRELVASNGWGW